MPATALNGTILDGRVELDAPADLPDGTRVRFVPDPLGEDEDDLGPPPEPYDRETELAILRESHADAVAGRTRPLDVVMDEIRTKYGLPSTKRG